MSRDEQDLLIDRHLAWLEFNRRALTEAEDHAVSLLERIKFLAIFSSNLDEFFMVRAAGLKRRLCNTESQDPEHADTAAVLSAISRRVHEVTEEQHQCFLKAVLVELQAPFDANMTWARALEEVGAYVVYGLVGYKTHCTVCLIVRQDTDKIRRYCRTACVYSDLGIFTCRDSFGEDLTELFNFLTGYTRPQTSITWSVIRAERTPSDFKRATSKSCKRTAFSELYE